MSDPFVGEIRMFGGNFAPLGWAFCDGRTLSIAENEVLYNLIGTTYGGDGLNTYALPDLRSRTPVHIGSDSFGNTYVEGMVGGVEAVTLTSNQIGLHNHPIGAVTTSGSVPSPANALPAVLESAQNGVAEYGNGANNLTNLAPASIGNAGGNAPHSNRQPYLAINFIIALYGIYPTQG
jgi:microcystin-dependent protein